MSNKTSDKNVGSIEEDIRILQEKDCMWHYPETRIEEAISNILADYTRQKQINEEHQKINGELRQAINTVEKEKADWIKAYQEEKDSQFELLKRIKELESKNKYLESLSECQHSYLLNSIPKQVVIDVLQEYKDKTERYDEYRIQGKETDVEYYENIANTIVVQVLQELLEGEKQKCVCIVKKERKLKKQKMTIFILKYTESIYE